VPMRNGRLLLASGLGFCVAALASLAALYLVTTRPGERHRAASYLPSGYALVVTGNDTAGLECAVDFWKRGRQGGRWDVE